MNDLSKLSEEGANAYLWCTWILAITGSVPASIWSARFAFLRDNSQDGPAKSWAAWLLEEIDIEEEASAVDTSGAEEREVEGDNEAGITIDKVAYVEVDEPPMLQLLMAIPKHGKWEFHQTDADPHPSIPHGHKQASKIKLDAYLGFTWQGARQVGKIPRNSIIAMWNDQDFRDFSLRAISWFMAENPNHRWNVRNPRKLPRRRR